MKKILYVVPWKLLPMASQIKTQSSFGKETVEFLVSRSFIDIPGMMISKVLKKNFDVFFVDLSADGDDFFEFESPFKDRINLLGMKPEIFLDLLHEVEPEIVLIPTMFTIEYPAVFYLSKLIKKNFPETILVIGGKSPTILPNWYTTIADIVFMGENIEILPQILDNLEYWLNKRIVSSGINQSFFHIGYDFQNVFFNSKGEYRYTIEKNTRSSFHQPAWALKEKSKNIPNGILYNSRGCPFKCGFCSVSSFDGEKLRKRSFENMCGLFEFQYEQFNIKAFQNLSDLFGVVEEEKRFLTEVFAKKRKEDNKLSIINTNAFLLRTFFERKNSRLNVNRKYIEMLNNAGLTTFTLGVDSFSRKFRKNKGISFENIKQLVMELKDIGAKIEIYMIFGYPLQTKDELLEDVKKTEELLKWSDTATWRFLQYFPGTEYYKWSIEKNFLTEKKYYRAIWKNISYYHVNRYFNFTKIPTKYLKDFENYFKKINKQNTENF
jgi:radical SAM superfamily enzyme YgiQ (UPF0313 family)